MIAGILNARMIEDFPYEENFDTVSVPDLPEGWIAVINCDSSSIATIETKVRSNAPSAPNAVMMKNGMDHDGDLILISPEFNSLNNKKILFSADGSHTDPVHLLVGVMTVPEDPGSFRQIQSILLDGSFADYSVVLENISEDERYVAFSYGWDFAYKRIYFDSFRAENLPTGASVSLDKEEINFGQVSNNGIFTESIKIKNVGIDELNFTLDFSSDRLSSSPEGDISLAVNDSVIADIMFNPNEEGDFSESLIITSNDPENSEIIVPVVAEVSAELPENIIQIGNGTEDWRHIPMAAYWKYSYSQTIYLREELGSEEMLITSVGFKYNGNNAWTDQCEIYFAYTDADYFVSGEWIDPEEFTMVYSGEINVEASEGWVEFELENPFFYDGIHNLVAAFHDGSDVSGAHGQDDQFYASPSDNYRCLLMRQDYSDVYPDLSTAFQIPAFANIRFHTEPVTVSPEISFSEDFIDFEEISLGDSDTLALSFENIGESDLIISSVYFENNADSVFSCSFDGSQIILESGESYSLNVIVNGIDTGNYNSDLVFMTNTEESEKRIPVQAEIIDYTIREFPYEYGFENGILGNPGWKNLNNLWETGSEANNGIYCARISYKHDESDAVLTMPAIELPDNPEFSFYWKDDDIQTENRTVEHDTTYFEISVAGSDEWNVLAFLSSEDNEDFYRPEVIDLSEYGNQTVSVRWRDVTDGSYHAFGAGVDDILIRNILSSPEIFITPEFLNYELTTGEFIFDNLTVANVGTGVLTWEGEIISDNPELFTLYSDSGEILVGEEETVALKISAEEAASGDYEAILKITSNAEEHPEVEISLSLTVIPLSDNDNQAEYVTELIGNYPNPFNPETRINYSLQKSDDVIVYIYNSKGQLVKKLVDEHQKSGKYEVCWTGKDENEKQVSSGIYFCKMQTSSYHKINKMVLMK